MRQDQGISPVAQATAASRRPAPFRWLVLALGVATAGHGAQVNDLNALIAQAGPFAQTRMQAQGDPEERELFQLGATRGTPGGTPHKAADLQHWVLTYRIRSPERTAPRHGGAPQSTLQVDWRQGAFRDIVWSPEQVMDCRSLEGARIDISVGQAIQGLAAAGVVGGFQAVNLVWPTVSRGADGPIYLFICQEDPAFVAVSAQTGRVVWKDSLNPPFDPIQ